MAKRRHNWLYLPNTFAKIQLAARQNVRAEPTPTEPQSIAERVEAQFDADLDAKLAKLSLWQKIRLLFCRRHPN